MDGVGVDGVGGSKETKFPRLVKEGKCCFVCDGWELSET
jgi:hypothetical protein